MTPGSTTAGPFCPGRDRDQGLAESETTTMHDADEASIGALMTSFLHAVSFKAGDQTRYG